MSKDALKKLKRAGGIAGAAVAAFAIAVLTGAALMEKGTLSTDAAKAVLACATVLCAAAGLTVWRLQKGNRTKRRKK